MTAITRFFFRTPAPASVGSILHWWESRRFAYNIAVGAAGVTSIVTFLLFAAMPPVPVHAMVPPIAIIGYGIMANVCYSAGPVLDILICRTWGSNTTRSVRRSSGTGSSSRSA